MSDERNPLLKRAALKSRQSPAYHRSWKQEKEGAKRLGGFTTPGSGSKSTKGDVVVKNTARVEYKCTSKKSFPVTLEMIGKIRNAAVANNQIPFVEVEFLGAFGKPLTKIAILPTEELEILLTRMRDAETKVEELNAARVASERSSGQFEQHDDGCAPQRRQAELRPSRKQRDPEQGAAPVLREVPRLVVPRGQKKTRWQTNSG